ncbi:MAG: hypothetical protein ACKV22_19685 [Bryobacteraceae bacterium]
MDRLGLPLALSTCQTTFGKLVLLASQRDPHTGVYKQIGLARLKPENADHLLRSTHEEVFAKWIAFSLEEQMKDLAEYFSSLPVSPATVVKLWRSSQLHRSFIPESAPESDKALFLLDMETLFEVIFVPWTEE